MADVERGTRGGAWHRHLRIGLSLLLPLLLSQGCANSGAGTARSNDPGDAAGDGGAAGSAVTGDSGASDGVRVDLVPATSSKQELTRLTSELREQDALDASGFAAKTAVPFGELGQYDPATAIGMDLLQKSALALHASELGSLSKNGFVVSAKRSFPSFMYGYASIYSQDLPVYVSADSILYSVHQSYDAMLASIEQPTLGTKLEALLSGMQSQLASAKFPAALQADTDVYLATARSLLAGSLVPPSASRNAAEVKALYELALAAQGHTSISAFGLKRDVDFSQFTPRGHYTAAPELEQYFRAMMWLGRIDLRVIDIDAETGSPVFRRRQLEGAVALRQLMNASGRTAWTAIDTVISAFVGEHDDMTPPQVDGLLNDLGAADVAALSRISDQKLAQAVIDGGYGAQRIASQIVISGAHTETLPLARSFALMGQRYVLDSEVLANVVYDRVLHEDVPERLMPSPLDVAYAALGNDQAGMLLAPELSKYGYAPELADLRLLADEHGDDYWQGSLYNTWLAALRTLSPSAAAPAVSSGMPSVAGTDAWGRRLLNTQLASWSELRHDTLLYAKQSYTAAAACSFPAAYVDPYPAFFSALVSFAERGKAAVAGLPDRSLDYYFTALSSAASTLRDMARDELQGAPLSAEHLAFINRAIRIEHGCDGTPYADGWYADLFYSETKALELDPSIADVHTQPTDEAGNDVGHVLHIATGMPQLMVVTVDTCAGAQAYVGLASSYYEHVTNDYERLTDQDWSQLLMASAPPRPAWLPDAFVP